ncbi:virulence factor TspB C-terminal domain-related protein [Enterobacter mori]
MDHHFKGLIAALALSAGSAHALYVQATPPAGWSAGGGAGGSVTGSKMAINSMFSTGSVSTSASLNMGGRNVALPASLRFASNAPRVAASAIMLHPGIRTAASIAGWLGLAALVYDEASGLWKLPDPNAIPSDGVEWRTQQAPYTWHSTLTAACEATVAQKQAVAPGWAITFKSVSRTSTYVGVCNATEKWLASSGNPADVGWNLSGRPSQCPPGWYYTESGCTQTPQPKTLTTEQAVEEIIKHPMPAEVPRHIPVPLPVEQPNIQPVFIPTGDPVKNPNFNPSEAPSPSNPPQVQPGVEAKPAPAPGSPWQVETTPVNRPVEDPSAPPSREPQPLPDTGGGPSGNEPKDPDKTDFCEKYPTVIACQELKHEDDDTKLPEKAIDLDFNPIPGFQGAKSCPAFPSIGNALGGRQISWQPFCDQLAAISNLLLALAWLYAAWILYSSRGN